MKYFGIIILLNVFLIISITGREGIGPGEQEWGYVTVRPGAHTFWWLYFTTADVNSNYHEKPLIIWLQGGPGVSSTGFGNFMELGPLDENLKHRNYTWVKYYNILFIDNPVGTGFSYVNNSDALATNLPQIATDLLVCMKHFYQKFPEFADTATYIVGESYGGKYTVELAKIWYEEQKKEIIKSNLKGIALGNAFISPVDSIKSSSEFLFQMGMLDSSSVSEISKVHEELEIAIEEEKWIEARNLLFAIYRIMNLENLYIDRYNILNTNMSPDLPFGNLMDLDFSYMMNHQIKKALNLNSTFRMLNGEVIIALMEDYMKPVTDTVEHLLNFTDIKVYVYNGQLDSVVPTSGTVRWLDKLRWENSTVWPLIHRSLLFFNDVIEGYIKQCGNLKMFWIFRSGHMAPSDNPNAVLAIMKDLTTS